MRRTGLVVAVWFAFYLLVLISPPLRVLKGNSDFLDKYTAGQLLLSLEINPREVDAPVKQQKAE